MGLVSKILFSVSLAYAAPDPVADETRDLFDEAATQYETSDYSGAVATYTEAYRLSADIADKELRGRVQAAILFNLARAHSRTYGLDGDPTHLLKVVDLLEKYLAQTADLADQFDAEELLEEARAELAYLEEQERASQEAVQDEPAAPPPTVVDTRGARGLEAAGYTLLGLGIASGGAAITGAVLATQARDEHIAGPTAALRDDAKAKGDTANLLIIAGSASAGVLITTGVIMAATGAKRRKRASTTAWASPTGAGLTVGGRF